MDSCGLKKTLVGSERPCHVRAVHGEGFDVEIADEIGCFELQKYTEYIVSHLLSYGISIKVRSIVFST